MPRPPSAARISTRRQPNNLREQRDHSLKQIAFERQSGLEEQRLQMQIGNAGDEISELGHQQTIQADRIEIARKQLAGAIELAAKGYLAIRCSPFHTASAFHPIIEHLKRVFGWQPEDTAPEHLAKLEAGLAGFRSLPLSESVRLFADLMSVPASEDRYPRLPMTAQQQRDATLDAIIAWLIEVAERAPVLTAWEDLHWADPTTLETLGMLIEQAPTAAMLVVATYRPELTPPWPQRSHMIPITLNRLERPEVETMVGHLSGGRSLPAEVIDHIVAKADGVPLYVEELTKAIPGSGVLEARADIYVLTGALTQLHIPETLQDSLMARLDRAPRLREVAQLGSALGREFAYDMISALAGIEEDMLQSGLGQLVVDELLYQRGRPPRSRYLFKHALIQDAAYQSLLKRTRQQYHERVAKLLEDRFPEVASTQPELVAHHYTEANCPAQAIAYWLKAGVTAARQSAERDALLKPASDEAASPAAMLARLKGIGPETAAVLWSEGLFRQFDNRRQVAAYAGLAPTPWQSGSIDHEQGVSKAGNPRLRTTMVELAWLWLQNQPTSALSLWFNERVRRLGGRMRKTIISPWRASSSSPCGGTRPPASSSRGP